MCQHFNPKSGQNVDAFAIKPTGFGIMLLLFQFAYATAVGFTAAGFISTLYVLFTGKAASLTQPVKTVEDGLRTIFLSSFAGPWMLASASYKTRKNGSLSAGFFVAGMSLSWVWGLCFGIILITIAENLYS